MTPKFSVGEVVILQSRKFPERNGEYEVVKVLPHGADHGFQRVSRGNFGYVLSGGRNLWAESALRKKHQPGDMSFTELMVNLSQHVQASSHS